MQGRGIRQCSSPLLPNGRPRDWRCCLTTRLAPDSPHSVLLPDDELGILTPAGCLLGLALGLLGWLLIGGLVARGYLAARAGGG